MYYLRVYIKNISKGRVRLGDIGGHQGAEAVGWQGDRVERKIFFFTICLSVMIEFWIMKGTLFQVMK